MNRPLRRKIELAALAWLEENKDETPLEGLAMVTADGTTLAAELAYDASPTARPPTIEPQPPFLAALATVEADPDLPHVYTYRLTLHVRTDATNEAVSRADIDAILREAQAVMTQPINPAQVVGDGNREGGAFVAFTAKPQTPPDDRPTCIVPLAIYDLYATGAADENDETIWDGQLNFQGMAQDMDAFDYPPDEPEEPEEDP
jgi:hypothetical protein